MRRWPGSEPGTLVVLHGLLDSLEGWATLGDGVGCTRIGVASRTTLRPVGMVSTLDVAGVLA